MSVQATQMTCAICDKQVALNIARRDWWLCTICGSYVCPECYVIFRESGQDFCPGTIVRGVEQHSPHFTRFLSPRTTTPNVGEQPTVVMLGNIRRRTLPPTGGRVIILGDVDRERYKESNSTGNNDDS